jgi:hypothetical protein
MRHRCGRCSALVVPPLQREQIRSPATPFPAAARRVPPGKDQNEADDRDNFQSAAGAVPPIRGNAPISKWTGTMSRMAPSVTGWVSAAPPASPHGCRQEFGRRSEPRSGRFECKIQIEPRDRHDVLPTQMQGAAVHQ